MRPERFRWYHLFLNELAAVVFLPAVGAFVLAEKGHTIAAISLALIWLIGIAYLVIRAINNGTLRLRVVAIAVTAIALAGLAIKFL